MVTKKVITKKKNKNNNMKTGTLKIESVKEVEGKNYQPYYNPNAYNANIYTRRSSEFKSLLIKGDLDGMQVSFFSPTVEIRKTEGLVNYICCDKNSWFEIVDGEFETARGAKMFDGGNTPNIAISQKQKINILVKAGDEIKISYSNKGEFRGVKTINRVKILKS